MNKYLIVCTLSLGLWVNSLSADALKNSLTNMLNEQESSSSMVNLSGLDINAKPKPLPPIKKTRGGNAVVATVNKHKILKKEADAHLKKRTQGKMSNVDLLPKEQRMRIVQELSLPVLALDSAKKELSSKEKEAIYIRLWMQKEALKIKITDTQVQALYDQLKKQSEESNSAKPIPSFERTKNKMRSQMIEKELMMNLMKEAEIKIK